jgi:hypothetical protein
VPFIIIRSRNNQHNALICTTSLFYILAPTCFGRSLPSSGSFLDPSELLEIQIEWVVYHIMCGYVTCKPECCGSICCASQWYKSVHSVGYFHYTSQINVPIVYICTHNTNLKSTYKKGANMCDVSLLTVFAKYLIMGYTNTGILTHKSQNSVASGNGNILKTVPTS